MKNLKKLTTGLTLLTGGVILKRAKAKAILKKFSQDTLGDGSFNTLITIVIAVIVAGLLILAINSFWPSLWSSVTNKITTTLDL